VLDGEDVGAGRRIDHRRSLNNSLHGAKMLAGTEEREERCSRESEDEASSEGSKKGRKTELNQSLLLSWNLRAEARERALRTRANSTGDVSPQPNACLSSREEGNRIAPLQAVHQQA
jgi:hypothetical protein